MNKASADLVKRLREMAQLKHDDLSMGDEAADEIERLWKIVGQVDDFLTGWHLVAVDDDYTTALHRYMKIDQEAYDDPLVSSVARERKEKIERLEKERDELKRKLDMVHEDYSQCISVKTQVTYDYAATKAVYDVDSRGIKEGLAGTPPDAPEDECLKAVYNTAYRLAAAARMSDEYRKVLEFYAHDMLYFPRTIVLECQQKKIPLAPIYAEFGDAARLALGMPTTKTKEMIEAMKAEVAASQKFKTRMEDK